MAENESTVDQSKSTTTDKLILKNSKNETCDILFSDNRALIMGSGALTASFPENLSVGIGTTTPDVNSKLDVFGKIRASSLDISGDLNINGILKAPGGISVQGSSGHLEYDGALYRHQNGQVYLTVDDCFYIRDKDTTATDPNDRQYKFYFNTNDGYLTCGGIIAGTSSALVVSGDKVGIGTATPDASSKLDVSGKVKASSLEAGIGNALVVKESNVGIGTNNPDSKLDVSGNIACTGITVNGSGTAKSLALTDPNGLLEVQGGISLETTSHSNRSSHLDRDGAIYRYGGQVYLTVDDNFYIRHVSTGNTWKFHFDTQAGKLTIDGDLQVNGTIYSNRDINCYGTLRAHRDMVCNQSIWTTHLYRKGGYDSQHRRIEVAGDSNAFWSQPGANNAGNVP